MSDGMSDGDKLSAFKMHMRRKIAAVQELTLCSELNENDEFVMGELQALSDLVEEMEGRVSGLRRELGQREERVQRGEAALREMKAQKAQLSMINATLPNLSQLQTKNNDDASTAVAVFGENNTTSSSSSAKLAPKDHHSPVPVIAYITQDEFDKLPHYHKSRMNIDKLNAAIDEISAILTKKYKLLSSKYSKIKERQDRDLFNRYTEEETPELKSWLFFTRSSLVKNQVLKTDQTGKSMLLVLRYLDRIKMQSGGGITRYVVMVHH
jgi:chromosome segregation ATPase